MEKHTDKRKKVIALGFFDGIHLGHQALLRRAVERAQEQDMTPAVFTFDRSPKEFVTGVPVPLLTTAESRREVVRSLFPIEDVIIVPFDREMMTMAWEDFLRMLVQTYQAGWVVAGHDYRFGYRHLGTPALLEEWAPRLGLGCDVIPAVTLDGITVSSTHIRLLLEQGDVENANRFLGYLFTVFGRMENDPVSRPGSPLLRLSPPAQQLVPARGVYLIRVEAEGGSIPAAAAVTEPSGGAALEIRPLGPSARLPGQQCRLLFLKRLYALDQDFDPAGLPGVLESAAGEAEVQGLF